MSLTAEIKQEAEVQMYSIPAKRLKEKLNPIKSQVAELTHRWFWELLQNASDYNDEVNVRLTIENNTLTFSHTGSPFRTVDVLNVISPDSGKDGDEIALKDNIGKFGSGLISTHVLSSHLNVKGIVKGKGEATQYFNFEILLDRSDPESKQFLMNSIKTAKHDFANNYQETQYTPGKFQTHFSYDLTKTIFGINGAEVARDGIKYITDILPYTLSFMRKVLSVEIINKATRFHTGFSEYAIRFQARLSEPADFITFQEIRKSGPTGSTIDEKTITMYVARNRDVESAVMIADHEVVVFPKNISRLFCGLPLVGTEKVGLPIILNSLAFNPTVERDTLELTANDWINRQLMKKGADLYMLVLSFCKHYNIRGLYNLANITTTFNGSAASQTWFKTDLVKHLNTILLGASIVQNVEGDYIRVKDTLIPYASDKEKRENLYEVTSVFLPKRVPARDSYEDWLYTLDFDLMPDLRYCLGSFLSGVDRITDLNSIALHERGNPIAWLKEVFTLVIGSDAGLVNVYPLFLNSEQKLCKKEKLYYADNLPAALICINNELNREVIENTFLHSEFAEFRWCLGPDRTRDTAFLAKRVDEALCRKYKENNGSPAKFIPQLTKLLQWYDESNRSRYGDSFPWFDGKRATLFLETFKEDQQNQALRIAQSGKMGSLDSLAASSLTSEEIQEFAEEGESIAKSGKMKVLASLASSDLTIEDLELLAKNAETIAGKMAALTSLADSNLTKDELKVLVQKDVSDMLVALEIDEVDDENHAIIESGQRGEALVYQDLVRKFSEDEGYKVIWSSKEVGEPRFDFEVQRGKETLYYIEAKATTRKFTTNEATCFFLKKSQWDYIENGESVRNKYLIARVFLESQEIKYLEVNFKKDFVM